MESASNPAFPDTDKPGSKKNTRMRSRSPAGKRRWGKIVLLLALAITPCAIGILWYYYFGSSSGPKPVTYMVPMRDSVRLATDVYLPAGDGPFPVILYRTPYDKDSDPGPLYVLDYGVGIVAQDHRGCHASEGNYTAFGMDGQDANDTITWLKTQPWFNGYYASMGGSARGITQYMQVPYLDDIRCQYIEVATPDLFSIALFQGGVPRKMLAENWLAGIGHSEYYRDTVFDDLSPTGQYAMDHRVDPWEWANVTWPAIHRGGWFDCFGQGILDGFSGYQYRGGEGGKGQSRLIMGPWTHDLGNNMPGELQFPANARSDPWSNQIFEAMFAERVLGLTDQGDYRTMPNVTYYVMGDTGTSNSSWNRWATADQWPVPHTNQTLYFQPDASMDTSLATSNRNYTYVFDPRTPVVTVGGANLMVNNRGPFGQRGTENARSDVLHFDYPVTTPILITGRIWAHLFITSNCTDTDFTVKLMDVYPGGTSYLLCDGIVRMRYRNGMASQQLLDGMNQTVYEAWADLWSTSYVFNAGHTVRVSVSSSNYPRFDVNPNTGAPIELVEESTPMYDAQNTVLVSPAFPSGVVLPIPTAAPVFV